MWRNHLIHLNISLAKAKEKEIGSQEYHLYQLSMELRLVLMAFEENFIVHFVEMVKLNLILNLFSK